MRPSRRPALKLVSTVTKSGFGVRGDDAVCSLGRLGDTPADVAELVDALVSGTSGGNIVGVQVSPSALPFTGEGPLRRHDRPEDFKRI